MSFEFGLRGKSALNIIIVSILVGLGSSGVDGDGGLSSFGGLLFLILSIIVLFPIDINVVLDGGFTVLIVDIPKPSTATPAMERDPFRGREERADDGNARADVVGSPDKTSTDGEEEDEETDQVVGPMHESEENEQDAANNWTEEHGDGDGDGGQGGGDGRGNLKEREGELTDDDTARTDGQISSNDDEEAEIGTRRIALPECLMADDDEGKEDDDPIGQEDQGGMPPFP